ncbi:hypothetical protein [Candidatus Formimonas warabiya]|uniref:Uncharacterized protein n=1 Tax=Formimonas warabiya TaxID=1761012 RepID=A0A3G1KRT1_FORW1|nr:hypothetical protein [Candidatus Formimonas warabiya]ATW25192.1 hypothetical protein DCMF_10790 [Candidatus Formimonas warabiya]
MLPCNWYGMCPFGPSPNPFMRALEDEVVDDEQALRQDPPPILSNPTPSRVLFMRKELSGYPNYGNPSGNADILYTNTQGTWTFNLPAVLALVLNNARRVELVIRGALDDHYNVPESRYSMSVLFNGVRQNVPARLPFVHGRPSGQRFDNWNELVLTVTSGTARMNNRVTIRNTSNTGDGDWIAFDWIELRFFL